MNHQKEQYLAISDERHTAIGRPLDRIVISEDGTIDWGKCGQFELLPACPPERPLHDHKYTGIRCFGMPAEEDAKPLPEAYNITGSWTLQTNWLLTATLVCPPQVKPRVCLPCRDFWDGSETVARLFDTLPAHGKREARKKSKAQAKLKAKAKAESEQEKKDRILKQALSRLRKSF